MQSLKWIVPSIAHVQQRNTIPDLPTVPNHGQKVVQGCSVNLECERWNYLSSCFGTI